MTTENKKNQAAPKLHTEHLFTHADISNVRGSAVASYMHCEIDFSQDWRMGGVYKCNLCKLESRPEINAFECPYKVKYFKDKLEKK